ncbi:MAG: hypothetical protein CML68_17080 [Rhodobacteraceae bacterium]|nr:hypothetical protein [Paracoccaceae bacterium]
MPVRLGSSEDDTFDADPANDLFLGFSGNDRIDTGTGLDLVLGGSGADTIVIDTGVKLIGGGTGADHYVFRPEASGLTILADFQPGSDRINLSALGVSHMSELQITADSLGTVLTTGQLTIRLFVTPDQLRDSDIVFADLSDAPSITFEDLSAPDATTGALPDDYAGFGWDGFHFVALDETPAAETGGMTATSGDTVIANTPGRMAALSRDTAFDLESLSLSAAWRDGLQVTVSGYRDGTYLGYEVFSAPHGSARTVYLDDGIFDEVTYVLFTATGGSAMPGIPDNGPQYALDDLVIL